MIVTSAASEARDRIVVLGTWLVGIGALFIVKDQAGWDWGVAWPLWLILFGVAGMATGWLTMRRTRLGIWGVGWSVALMAVGILLLLSTTRTIDPDPLELVRWWPVAVVAVGIWLVIGAVIAREEHVNTDSVGIPIDGLRQAEIKLNFGGGALNVRQAQPGMLVSGNFEGGVRQKSKGAGRFELSPVDPGVVWFAGRPLRWDVGITPDIPVDLRVDSGANRSTIDLSDLRIRRLELHTGASETLVELPVAGETSVLVEAGLAAVTMEVPAGVAARVRGKMALGSTQVDEARFPRVFDGWASADYETAASKVDISVEGGLGSVTIR